MKNAPLTFALFQFFFFFEANAEEKKAPIENIPKRLAEQDSSGGDFLYSFPSEVTFLSDYRFRGESQTMNKPAIQGNISFVADFGNDLNTYIGLWGSNVKFDDEGQGNLELDFYAGAGYDYGPFTFDLGITYYHYPGTNKNLHYNYHEYQATAEYSFYKFKSSISASYSPDNFGKTGPSTYLNWNTIYSFTRWLSAYFFIGRQFLSNKEGNYPNYTPYGIGAEIALSKNTAIQVEFSGSTLKRAQCPKGCGSTVILGISRAIKS